MSYQNPRQEKIHCGTDYHFLGRINTYTLNEYIKEYIGHEERKKVYKDNGKDWYFVEYCLTKKELIGKYKRLKNKSHKRRGRKVDIRNHHKRTRQQYKRNLRNMNSDIILKGIGRER